uniref:PH01B001G05.16 protein n=1 Tax=Phyllostachys edulis TaxID=38705 RepID=L0P3M9_PHYED|nr:PH01B001G05.16 [Phyllostachys edulis]
MAKLPTTLKPLSSRAPRLLHPLLHEILRYKVRWVHVDGPAHGEDIRAWLVKELWLIAYAARFIHIVSKAYLMGNKRPSHPKSGSVPKDHVKTMLRIAHHENRNAFHNGDEGLRTEAPNNPVIHLGKQGPLFQWLGLNPMGEAPDVPRAPPPNGEGRALTVV